MDHLHINYGKLALMDIPRWKQPATAPPRRALGPFERPAAEIGIDAAARLSSIGRLIQEIKDLATAARGIPVRFTGLKGPMIKPPPTGLSVLTAGLGLSTAAFAGLGVSGGAGVYGSTTSELGVYLSRGGGYWTNVGVSGSVQLTFVFGPPSSFAGICWGVGIDLDIPGGQLGIGGMALFAWSGPPFEFLGVSCSLGYGVSALPASLSIQVSDTKIFPVP